MTPLWIVGALLVGLATGAGVTARIRLDRAVERVLRRETRFRHPAGRQVRAGKRADVAADRRTVSVADSHPFGAAFVSQRDPQRVCGKPVIRRTQLGTIPVPCVLADGHPGGCA